MKDCKKKSSNIIIDVPVFNERLFYGRRTSNDVSITYKYMNCISSWYWTTTPGFSMIFSSITQNNGSVAYGGSLTWNGPSVILLSKLGHSFSTDLVLFPNGGDQMDSKTSQNWHLWNESVTKKKRFNLNLTPQELFWLSKILPLPPRTPPQNFGHQGTCIQTCKTSESLTSKCAAFIWKKLVKEDQVVPQKWDKRGVYGKHGNVFCRIMSRCWFQPNLAIQ